VAGFDGATFKNDFLISFDHSSARTNLGNYQNYALAFSTNNAERVRINADGQVGIGIVNDGGSTLDTNGMIRVKSSSTVGDLVLAGTGNAGLTYGGWVRGYSVTGQGGRCEVGTMENNSFSPAIYINHTANVGIGGGANDLFRLQVEGGNATNFSCSGLVTRTYGSFGMNLYYDGDWKFAEQAGTYGFNIGIRSGGGMKFTVSSNASTGSGSAPSLLDSLEIDAAGRVFPTRIHNNASGASGATPMLASGVQTGISSAAGDPATNVFYSYSRTGNVVTVGGAGVVTPAAGGNRSTQIPLPIPTQSSQGGGAAAIDADTDTVAGRISIEPNFDRFIINWFAPNTNPATFTFSFTYEISA
jgi:hypothetical protein